MVCSVVWFGFVWCMCICVCVSVSRCCRRNNSKYWIWVYPPKGDAEHIQWGSYWFNICIVCLSKRIILHFWNQDDTVRFFAFKKFNCDVRDGTDRRTVVESFLDYFSILRHIKHYTHIYLNIKKCSDKYPVGLQFWSSWGVAPTIFKITLDETVFSKIVSNIAFPEFWDDFKVIFFVPN